MLQALPPRHILYNPHSKSNTCQGSGLGAQGGALMSQQGKHQLHLICPFLLGKGKSVKIIPITFLLMIYFLTISRDQLASREEPLYSAMRDRSH